MITFGEQVKKLRKEKRITQLELAQEIGVDFTYISKIENNKTVHSPSEKIIRKIAEVLETNADDLILLAEKVPKNLQETIFNDNDDFVASFLRAVPNMNEDQRCRIKTIVDETGENS